MIKKQIRLISCQEDYLNSLILKYPSDMDSLAEAIEKINNQFKSQIEIGKETLMQQNRSTLILRPYIPNNTKEQLHRYASQRKELETKLKELDQKLKKEGKSNSIISDKQRLQFLKRMKEYQEQLRKFKEENEQIREIKIQQKQEEERQEKERLMKQKQIQKRQEIKRRMQQLAEYKERRIQQIKERNRDYQEIAHQKILVHKIQEQYSKLQGITLEEKKKKLAQIREIHKPMSRNDFKDHMTHIREYRTMRENIREGEKDSKSLSSSPKSYYKSHWYKEVLNEQYIIEEQKEKEDKKSLLKQLKDRQKKYSEYIKHNFVPDTDEHLIEEREKRKPPPINRKKPKQIRKMGLLNLKLSKQKIISKEQLEEKRKSQADLHKIQPQMPKDYLQELKKNRRTSSLHQLKGNGSVMKMRGDPKTVRTFAEVLEKKALEREQLQRVKKSVLDRQVDDMYMGVLNAKLQLLDEQ